MNEEARYLSKDEPKLTRFIEEQELAENHATAQAERRALRRGKEPFDLDRLLRLYTPRSIQRVPERDKPENRVEWEQEYRYQYYVIHPEISTLEEFADLLFQSDLYE
ncbi:MAG: hypothetical protein D6805_05905 [Planctomycetota bacterium]|nr:MAG: hypothetical protein D6805_05905 [Planctomycetota bacterium]